MLRTFATFLVAFALILIPLGMGGGGGGLLDMGAAHAASAVGHCEAAGSAPAESKHSGPMGAGCAIVCAALPATERHLGEPWQPEAVSMRPMIDAMIAGIRPEGETPPPRIAPET